MSCPTGWHHFNDRACTVCASGAPRRKNTLCMESEDGSVVGCGKSGGAAWGGKPPFKQGKRLWFYRVKDAAAGPVARVRPATRRKRRLPFDWLFAGWWRDVQDAPLAALARDLGVSIDALRRLGIGWAVARRETPQADALIVGTKTPCRPPGTWVFPLRGADGAIVGGRVRTPRGSKYAINTSDGDGVLAPAGLVPGRTLLLPEGPTSTAALLTLGFNAIGRPANRGGVAAVLGYAAKLRPARVLLVADNDERLNETLGRRQWPGREGAEEVATALGRAGLAAEVVYPPAGIKDSRDWVRAGATAGDVRGAWASVRRAS